MKRSMWRRLLFTEADELEIKLNEEIIKGLAADELRLDHPPIADFEQRKAKIQSMRKNRFNDLMKLSFVGALVFLIIFFVAYFIYKNF